MFNTSFLKTFYFAEYHLNSANLVYDNLKDNLHLYCMQMLVLIFYHVYIAWP